MPIREVKIPVGVDDRTGRGLKNIESKFSRFAKAGLASVATAAAAGTTALVGLTRAATKSADEIGKLSLQLGISVKALSELKFIGEQTGVGFNALSISMQRSTRRISEAANGTGEAVKALDELGLSAQRLNQLAPDQQFEILAKALAGVTSETDQVRLAFKFFDSEGVRLLRTIKQTGGDFSALRGEARNLGAVMDEELTGKAADVNDAMNRIKTAGAGVGNALLNTLGPAIVDTANAFVAAINTSRQFLENLNLIKAVDNRDRLLQLARETELQKATVEQIQIQIDRLHELDGSRQGLLEVLDREQEKLQALREEQTQLFEIEKQRAELKGNSAAAVDVSLNGGSNADNGGDNGGDVDGGFFEGNPLEEAFRAEAEAREQRLEIARKNSEAIFTVEKFWADKLKSLEGLGKKQRLTVAKQTFLGLLSEGAKGSKKMFELNKKLQIADAAINAKSAILGAFAFGSKIGGPVLGAAFAAAAAAVTLSQINAIRSQEFGGAGGTPSAASAGAIPSQTPLSSDFNISDATQPSSNIINIDFRPGITDSAAVRDFIENDFAEALRDGAGLNVQVVAR